MIYGISAVCFQEKYQQNSMDDNAKGSLSQFRELFTVIPCAPNYFKR